jgi:hypothetical protein
MVSFSLYSMTWWPPLGPHRRPTHDKCKWL